MNKALVLLVLAVIIAAQWTFLSSFYSTSTDNLYSRTINVSGTSAVVVAKMDYISARVKFFIISNPGEIARVTFPNGSQVNVTFSYNFEVFLPKTGYAIGSLGYGISSGKLSVSTQEPVDAAVVPNVTESFFSDVLNPDNLSRATLYWFKVEGNAHVDVRCYGVPI